VPFLIIRLSPGVEQIGQGKRAGAGNLTNLSDVYQP
jgi:hypothetical protein